MKNIILPIILTAAFFCSACIVSFENPVSDSQVTTFDNRLLGKWREVDEKLALLNIYTDSDSRLVISLLDENNNAKLLFTATTIEIGKYHYLTLKPIDEEENTFLIARYAINGDELTTWLPDKVKFNELINKGKLGGQQKSYGEISVSNSSADIRKILESPESDELFEFFAKLKKQ